MSISLLVGEARWQSIAVNLRNFRVAMRRGNMKFGHIFVASAIALNVIGGATVESFAEKKKSDGLRVGERSPEDRIDPKIVTLYRHDPIAGNFDVTRGAYGHCYKESGRIRNCGTNLEIFWGDHSFAPKTIALVTGLEGNANGAVVDLGSEKDIDAKYQKGVPKGYSLLKGEWFTTLAIQGRRVFARFHYGDEITPITITEASGLYPKDGKSFTSAPAKIGHVYLLRQYDDRDGTEVVFKVLVLAMSENSVTLRYDLMRNKEWEPKAEETPTAQD